MRAVSRAVFRCRFSPDRKLAESQMSAEDVQHASLNSWGRARGRERTLPETNLRRKKKSRPLAPVALIAESPRARAIDQIQGDAPITS